MIEKRTIETPLGIKRRYFFDWGNMREYRRIVGGIAWPSGESKGFVCIVGEDDHERDRLKIRDFWVIHEHENRDVEKLIKTIYDLQNRYLIKTWYSNTDNVLMMHFVDKFNSKLSKKKTGIYIAPAPFCDDVHNLRLYANQVRGLTAPAKKTLNFGGTSLIPGVLRGLSPGDVQKKKAEDFPAIASLGYVLSGLSEPYADISKEREIHEQFIQQRTVEGL